MVSRGLLGDGVIGATREAGNGVIVVDQKVVDVPFSALGASCTFAAKLLSICSWSSLAMLASPVNSSLSARVVSLRTIGAITLIH